MTSYKQEYEQILTLSLLEVKMDLKFRFLKPSAANPEKEGHQRCPTGKGNRPKRVWPKDRISVHVTLPTLRRHGSPTRDIEGAGICII